MSSPSHTKIVVTRRGQITLPASIRRRLGIKEGDVVTLEERAGEIVVRPAGVLELEVYSDQEVARWKREDRVDSSTRSRIRKKHWKKPG